MKKVLSSLVIGIVLLFSLVGCNAQEEQKVIQDTPKSVHTHTLKCELDLGNHWLNTEYIVTYCTECTVVTEIDVLKSGTEAYNYFLKLKEKIIQGKVTFVDGRLVGD